MLKLVQVFFFQHYNAAIQSLNYLCNKPLATCVTSGIIAIALAIPALFWVLSDNLSQLTADWHRKGTVSLYLKLNQNETIQLQTLEHVKQTSGVANAVLKTPSDGLNELRAQEGMEDIMKYLSVNPLPAMIMVSPNAEFGSLSKINHLAEQFRKMDSVEYVQVDSEWAQQLDSIAHFTSCFARGLFLLLALIIILIIVTSLRLAVYRRQEEIQVLKLIGAQNRFISRPFLYSGIWYSLSASILAVFLVNIFMIYVGEAINTFLSAYEIHYSITLLTIRQILLLMFFAIIIGWLGARISVMRQLSSIEPQL